MNLLDKIKNALRRAVTFPKDANSASDIATKIETKVSPAAGTTGGTMVYRDQFVSTMDAVLQHDAPSMSDTLRANIIADGIEGLKL
jgi:hypothetical protein